MKVNKGDNEMYDWNKHVHHPLQSWEWGEFRKKMGLTVVRMKTEGKPFQFTIHTLPKLPYTIGYIPKGPPITNDIIQQLIEYGRKQKVIFFQLEPDVQKNEDKRTEIILHPMLKPSHHPLFTKYTFVLDLTKSEEQLLADMHPKTRYNLKIAQKHNVIIEQNNTETAFQEYLQLVLETTQRQGFYAHSLSYHKTMWETLSKTGIAKLWTAAYQGKILAAWIIFEWENTLYYPYGASSRENRHVMAPQLLLWQIALWGKKNKFTKFDLWGAMGPNPDTNDPFYGFHRFKSGFNPKLVEFEGSFDLVVHPYFYPLYCIADTIRWKILKKLKN